MMSTIFRIPNVIFCWFSFFMHARMPILDLPIQYGMAVL